MRDLGTPQPAVESLRDAVAFARALSSGDPAGAWEIYRGRSFAEQVGLAAALAHLLGKVIGDGDDGWRMLLALAEGTVQP